MSYETVRRWCAKFGQAYANQLRSRRPRPGDKWHLDEVFVKINGITQALVIHKAATPNSSLFQADSSDEIATGQCPRAHPAESYCRPDRLLT